MTGDTEDIIDQFLGESNSETTSVEVFEEAVLIEQQHKSERLVTLAGSDQTALYLEKTYSINQIESSQESTIIKLYSRYEARLGSMMVKTLGRSALQAAALCASYFLPIPEENRPKLVSELEDDPLVSNALNFAMAELFHKYGIYLAPFTAALHTANYCDFRELHKHRISNGISGGDDDTSWGETNYSGGSDDSSSTDNYKSNETKEF